MTTTYLSPSPLQQFTDNGGQPVPGGKLFTYLNLTTTKATTYADGLGATPNTNPIILDAASRASIFLPPGQLFTYVLAPSTDTDPPSNAFFTQNNVSAGGAIATLNFSQDTGTANTLVVSGLGVLTDGTIITLEVANTNTGPTTLNGAPVVLQNGASLSGGELQADGQYLLQWNTTTWQILGLSITPDKLRTPAEIAASVTPTNYNFPELHVHRYGAVGDGAANDQGPWQAAISVAATGKATRGEINCEQLPYLIGGTGTLTITGPVTINGGNAALNYVSGVGNSAQIRQALNAPILVLPTAGVGNGVAIRNINIVGTGGGNVQDGIAMTQTYPAYSRVFMQNVGIFNCGRYGINAASMYTSEFSNVYVQGCASGWILGPNAGANRYYNCSAVANTSVGFDLASTNGTDYFNGCVSEQNAYGIVVEAGGGGHKLDGIHTERNTTQSVWMRSGSNKTALYFAQCGASEPFPLNQGGAQNRWEGNFSTGDNTYPIAIQRVSTSITAQVNGSTLVAMPYSTTVPTTAMGLAAMTQNITPKAMGNHLIIRANGFAEIAGGGTMTVAIFLNGNCLRAWPFTVAAGVPAPFAVETEYTTVPLALTLASAPSAGATSVALSAGFTGVTGPYTLVLSDVEMRSVTLTNGSMVVTAIAALLNNCTTSVSALQQLYTAQVNIGSTTASDTITLGGHSGTTRYGGVEVANISIEEFRPSTG